MFGSLCLKTPSSKICKNINVNSLKTKCNLIETKTICEKNHKNIKKK